MGTQGARRAFTVGEYHRMADAGILTEDDRVELIDGEIVRMSPIKSRHASCVDRLTALFTRRLRDRAIVRVQNPIVLGRLSEPQPDVVILRPRVDYYATRHPGPADVLLLIEVGDATRAYDREVKLPLYARAGIAEVWLVDLVDDVLTAHTGPALESYRERVDHARGSRLAPAAFPRVALRVNDILG
jgi:Uma2 family endonuclease